MSLVLMCGIGAWGVVSWSGLVNLAQRVKAGYAVLDLAISPDGQLLASAITTREYYHNNSDAPESTEETRNVQIRQATSGKIVRTLVGHTDYLLTVAFSPDGRLLASGSADRTVKTWNVGDGSLVTTLPVTRWVARSLTWSPDGRMLALNDGAVTMLWQAQGWQLRTTLQAGGSQIAFSLNGLFIASIDGNEVTVWGVQDGQPVISVRTSGYTFAWSPDGRFIAAPGTGSETKDIGVWRVQDGQRVAKLEGHTARVHSIAWSPDGQTIASASGERFTFDSPGDRTIWLWRRSDWQQIRSFRAHRDVITSLVFTPDHQQLISGSLDETIRWWKVK
jgi:WD40 repeat protein